MFFFFKSLQIFTIKIRSEKLREAQEAAAASSNNGRGTFCRLLRHVSLGMSPKVKRSTQGDMESIVHLHTFRQTKSFNSSGENVEILFLYFS
jgi:hypothetical protein